MPGRPSRRKLRTMTISLPTGERRKSVRPSKRVLAESTSSDPRWAAVLARDASADGTFWYSVETTGVYCRPSCGARAARPENIRFHASPTAAERAGFRACRRCKPNELSLAAKRAAQVADLCRWIEGSGEPPSLDALAARAGMSPYHLHRVFKSVTGLTPKAYASAHRTRRVREKLTHSETVTAAIYESGYQSSARFYEEADHRLGMTPTAYRSGGTRTEIRFAVGECSLGAILVAASERGVCAILLGEDPDRLARDLQDQFPHASLVGDDAAFEQWMARVVGYIERPNVGLELPLDIRGTAFQERVWRALLDIPVGSTMSYQQIASRVGAPRSARAVARACAQNVLAVAIPCHRVVRNDGALSGYRWGVARKRELLDRESNS